MVTAVDALARLGLQGARGAGSLSFPGDGDFASKLTLGQIIKGRVLRSYDGGQRHLVDFGGEQRVVDSSVPLRPDEVFQGRVVGLGEKVQLQKLAAETPAAAAAPAALPQRPAGAADGSLAALFARFGVELPPARVAEAQVVVNRLPQPATAASAALVLAKLGLPLDAQLIRLLHARLSGQEAVDTSRGAVQLATAPAAVQHAAAVAPPVEALAAALAQLAAPLPLPVPAAGHDAALATSTSGDGGGARRDPREPGSRLLNVQTGGAVAHRLGRLPLLVDGRLLELELALFDEPGEGGDGGAAPAVPRHRQVVIGLDTASLGRVEVRARIAGRHLALTMNTDASERTQALAGHAAALRESLSSLGFEVDAMAYETQAAGAPGAPLQAVVEHLITPGSVRLWA